MSWTASSSSDSNANNAEHVLKTRNILKILKNHAKCPETVVADADAAAAGASGEKFKCHHEHTCAYALLQPGPLQEWFNEVMRTWKSGTITSVKSSLKKFLEYIEAFELGDQTKTDSELLHLEKTLKEAVKSRLVQLKTYNGIIAKKKTSEMYERFEKDQHNLITLDDIRQLESSQFVNTAMAHLASLTELYNEAAITNTSAADIRDVLVTLLFFRSLQRTGAFIGMTVGEVKGAQIVELDSGRIRVISVHRHKTNAYNGPARICVEDVVYAAMIKYLTFIRPLWAPSAPAKEKRDNKTSEEEEEEEEKRQQNEPFFLASTGNPLTSATISWGISKVGKRAGLKHDLTNITNLRKSMVTILYLRRPDDRAHIADQMSHRVSTGEAHYKNACVKIVQSAETMNLVRSLIDEGKRDEGGDYYDEPCLNPLLLPPVVVDVPQTMEINGSDGGSRNLNDTDNSRIRYVSCSTQTREEKNVVRMTSSTQLCTHCFIRIRSSAQSPSSSLWSPSSLSSSEAQHAASHQEDYGDAGIEPDLKEPTFAKQQTNHLPSSSESKKRKRDFDDTSAATPMLPPSLAPLVPSSHELPSSTSFPPPTRSSTFKHHAPTRVFSPQETRQIQTQPEIAEMISTKTFSSEKLRLILHSDSTMQNLSTKFEFKQLREKVRNFIRRK
jgi:hypothetical protein